MIRHNLTSKERIDNLLRFARDYGYTDLFVQIRGRGDAYYQSSLVPRAELIKNVDFDPLEYLLSQAHKQQLRVHAWLNIYFLWSSEKPPADPNHLLYRHPEWIATDSKGISDIRRDWRLLIKNGFEGIYLSPVIPAVNDYLLKVIQEVVTRYPVDGIHLDYIRFQSVDYGYNPIARDLFRQQYGIDPMLLNIDDSRVFLNLDREEFINAKQAWNQFRRDGVTSLVRRIHQMIMDTRPSLFLSAAVKADISTAREFYLQDWAAWAREKIVDFLIPMNYVEDGREFERRILKMKEELDDFPLMMGIGVYNQSKYSAASKLYLCRKYKLPGVVIFSYDDFLKSSATFDLLFEVMME